MLPAQLDLRPPRRTFSQTDLDVHAKWAQLSARKPVASAILHLLVAEMGRGNAVVVSHKTMAKLLGFSDRAIRNGVTVLEQGNWVQVVRLGAGRECAYVLNSRVAWTEKRDNLRLARFSAEVIADLADQPANGISEAPLHQIPQSFDGEIDIPS